MQLDNASEVKLNQVVAYLNEKSDKRLWDRLYQKIIFLLELESYKKHQQLSIGVSFKSYHYGPYSDDISQALQNPNNIEVPQSIKVEVDDILKKYDLNLENIDNKSQEKMFQNVIEYIHSLYIYNITPFNANFDFSLYNFKDLFKTINSNLNGEFLKEEKYNNTKIELKAKEYEHLFE